jgi:hypothetical protein
MRDEARPRAPEPPRNIFFEPPYSIREATAGLLVIGICRLLYWWLWAE